MITQKNRQGMFECFDFKMMLAITMLCSVKSDRRKHVHEFHQAVYVAYPYVLYSIRLCKCVKI